VAGKYRWSRGRVASDIGSAAAAERFASVRRAWFNRSLVQYYIEDDTADSL